MAAPTKPASVAMVAHWDWVLHHFRMPIARGLKAQGCRVTFVCPPGPFTDRFLEEGFAWRQWDVDRRSVNPIREIGAIRRLAELYRRERFDVVHHFTIKPNLYGSLAARRSEVPVVVNMFSGLGYVFSDSKAAKALLRALAPVMRYAFGGTWMLALNTPDLDRLSEMGLAHPQRSRAMPEGVDLEAFQPRFATAVMSTEPTVVMACRLLRDKGVFEFVEAARKVREAGVAARFQLAGEPDYGNPTSIQASDLEKWTREGVVELLGHRSDMSSVLASADIAALPTHYMEGQPRFLQEAAAAGLPLVATTVPGCEMVVSHRVNGLLVPPRDSTSLAQAIIELAQDDSLRAELGHRSRRRAEEDFGEEGVVNAYVALYRDLGIIR